jgi:hypothetical protein
MGSNEMSKEGSDIFKKLKEGMRENKCQSTRDALLIAEFTINNPDEGSRLLRGDIDNEFVIKYMDVILAQIRLQALHIRHDGDWEYSNGEKIPGSSFVLDEIEKKFTIIASKGPSSKNYAELVAFIHTCVKCREGLDFLAMTVLLYVMNASKVDRKDAEHLVDSLINSLFDKSNESDESGSKKYDA